MIICLLYTLNIAYDTIYHRICARSVNVTKEAHAKAGLATQKIGNATPKVMPVVSRSGIDYNAQLG